MKALQAKREESPRPGLYDALYAASTFLTANLLWIICSLPLVTLPAATAALFAVLSPWARGMPADSPLMVFPDAMRRYWLPASVIVLLDVLAAGVCGLNLLILSQMPPGQPLALLALGMTVTVVGALLSFNVYAWPLMVSREMATRALLREALRLALAHPLWALFTALLAALPVGLSLFLPQGFALVLSASAAALILNWGATRVIRPYFDIDTSSQERGDYNQP